MRAILLPVCFFLLMTSCGEKVIEEPKNLIPQEKMEAILFDLAMLYGANGTNISPSNKNIIKIMPFIFKKYKVDSIQFTESNDYYASIPSKYQAIYETVLDSIEKEEKVIGDAKKRRNDSIGEVSKRRSDSIKNSKKSKVKDSLPKK